MSDFAADYAAMEARILPALRDDLREEEFGALALEVHAFQRRWNEPLARACGAMPRTWRKIPAVPQAMFKSHRISCVPPELVTRTFRTSGTTGETRGEHHLFNTTLYEAAVLAGWRRAGLAPHYALVISPGEDIAPDSSLACMWRVVSALAPQRTGFVRDGDLDDYALASVLRRFTTQGRPAPVALLGTALSFVNFFERQPDFRAQLAPGSYAVETGGFKGSGREFSRAEVHALLAERLGLDDVWNEYGMCELSSQFYARGGGAHTGGPWVRTLVISPETGREVAVGESGVLRIFDLANLSGSLAIQTADLAIRREEGFDLLGRDPAAIPRGCSRMVDELFQRSSPGRHCESGLLRSEFRVLPLETEAALRAAELRTLNSELGTLNTAARAAALATAASAFHFLGEITAEAQLTHLAAELGHADALDRFVPYAGHHARAIAPATILHIHSGNTPAAALQTLTRGLLLGSRNLCKLPSAGLPEVAQFIAALPPEMAALVETSDFLPDDWLALADALIVFGSDETIAHFRALAQPWQTFIAHGHRVSLGIVFDDPDFSSVPGAARDVAAFDQQGCLSPHVFYIHGSHTEYAARLAVALAELEKSSPRAPLTLSEHNSIRTLRDETAFRIANGEPRALHASEPGTEWTVIADATPGFPRTPLNRVIFVKPAALLAEKVPHLSTCGIFPPTAEHAEAAARLGATRICAIGKMQSPPLAWHHDGQPTLAPLVRWVDFD